MFERFTAEARRVVVLAQEEALAITQTLEELGPQLSRALRQIVQNDRPVAAVMRITRLFAMVPAHERRSFYALVRDVLPFSRTFQRLWPRSPRAPATWQRSHKVSTCSGTSNTPMAT